MRRLLVTLRAYLELARVSNLPTCITNVLVGFAVGVVSLPRRTGAISVDMLFFTYEWSRFVVAAAAVSLLYVAGMALNDAVDAPVDRRERPDRPIPSGRISRGAAFAFAALTLAGGVTLATTLGAAPARLSLALAGAIVLYDLLHRRLAVVVVLMGVCRGLVYALGAVVVTRSPDPGVLAPIAGATTLYVVVLTVLARGEHDERARRPTLLAWAMPVIVLAPAAALPPAPLGPWILSGALVIAWLVRSVRLLRTRPPRVRAAVMGWLGAICLADAWFLTLLDAPRMALAAVVLFVLTTIGHRAILGT